MDKTFVHNHIHTHTHTYNDYYIDGRRIHAYIYWISYVEHTHSLSVKCDGLIHVHGMGYDMYMDGMVHAEGTCKVSLVRLLSHSCPTYEKLSSIIP